MNVKVLVDFDNMASFQHVQDKWRTKLNVCTV
jgi:hypothetical protein